MDAYSDSTDGGCRLGCSLSLCSKYVLVEQMNLQVALIITINRL